MQSKIPWLQHGRGRKVMVSIYKKKIDQKKVKFLLIIIIINVIEKKSERNKGHHPLPTRETSPFLFLHHRTHPLPFGDSPLAILRLLLAYPAHLPFLFLLHNLRATVPSLSLSSSLAIFFFAQWDSEDRAPIGRGSGVGGSLRVRVSERCGMLQALMNLISPCWKPFGHGDNSSAGIVGGREGKDGLLWFRDIGKYGSGEFSMAVVQANQVLEDQSQIESGPLGTFVGVYDGHGGPDASRYVCDHLFRNFQGSQFYSYVGLVEFNSRSWSLLWNLLFLVIIVICGFHGFAFSEHLFLSFIFLLFTRIKSSWKMHGDTVFDKFVE